MIAKQHRFHGHHSLNYVYRNGRTYRSDLISLRAAPSKRQDYRAAVVVSKKISKSAVVRNKLRRRIYEIVRTQRQGSEPWRLDLVFTVHDVALTDVKQDKLQAVISDLLHKAGAR